VQDRYCEECRRGRPCDAQDSCDARAKVGAEAEGES
jgi:hypothetical protein